MRIKRSKITEVEKKSSRQTEEKTIEANRVTAAVDRQLFSAISVTL
jgi:hypothetical protein